LDEISHGPERDFRLPSGRWLLAAAAAGILAVAAALTVTGIGRHQGARPSRLTGAPGTFLLTCDSADWNQLNPGWRSSSLRLGPLWFADSSQSGYVRDDGSPDTAGAVTGNAEPSTDTAMPLEVAAGSTVVMKAASGTQPYFRFLSGFGAGTAYPLPSGDTGYTFVACPRQHVGPNGRVTDFLLGFSIGAGRTVPVEVWTSASPRPVWVTFTAPTVAAAPPTGHTAANCSPSTGACSFRGWIGIPPSPVSASP
jgi:hypothetical protein